jgi:hypothetical protein
MAVQASGEPHDTPARAGAGSPGGVRMAWLAQLLPFQRSATAIPAPVLELADAPTAVQADAAEHDTAASELSWPPGTGSVAKITQVAPFQLSASMDLRPWRLALPPTAMQADADEQDTPARVP